MQLTESAWCSSLRVRGWWMLTMKAHGVEISITGGVVEMVRELLLLYVHGFTLYPHVLVFFFLEFEINLI